MARNSDPITLTLHIHRETELAVEVSSDGTRSAPVWLAKCLVDIDGAVHLGRPHQVTLPRGLADMKGLV